MTRLGIQLCEKISSHFEDIPFRSPIGGCDRKAFEVMTNFPRPTALHTNKEYGMIIFVPK
jgi:alpha-galactosidase